MKSEGHVHLCTWDKSKGTFRVQVVNRPRVRAEGTTFEEADELLSEAITEATGDGENLREYTPLPPLSHGSAIPLTKRLTSVWPVRYTVIANAEALYHGGLCDTCRMPLGERTAAELIVESVGAGLDGMTVRLKQPFKGPTVEVFSEEFLGLLTPAERSQQHWRRISSVRKTKRAFFELLGSEQCVPFVALMNIGVTLTMCMTCGRRNPPFYSFMPPTPSRYLSAADIPRPRPSVLCVGGSEPQLAMTYARWAKVVGRMGSRQLASSDIGIVSPEIVDANPLYE